MKSRLTVATAGVALALAGAASYAPAQSGAMAAAQSLTIAPLPNSAEKAPVQPIRIENGRLTSANITLRQLIATAYQISPPQVVGPRWMSRRYRVQGPAEGIDSAMLPGLLQQALKQQLDISVRRTTRSVVNYALTTAGSGPRMPLASGAEPLTETPTPGGYELTGQCDMAALAAELSHLSHRPVVDRTGLKGRYAVSLTFAPLPPRGVRERRRTTAGNGAAGEPSAPAASPTLFDALQSQLGLTLEAHAVSSEVVVVERAHPLSR